MIGENGFQPCTPAGVMRMLQEYGIDPAGKHCVIVGRSNIVGKPQAMLMLRENATVTICHTRTPDLKAECLRADILVAAAGRVGLITGDMVKEGAVVIDVAMNRNEAGKAVRRRGLRRRGGAGLLYHPGPRGSGPHDPGHAHGEHPVRRQEPREELTAGPHSGTGTERTEKRDPWETGMVPGVAFFSVKDIIPRAACGEGGPAGRFRPPAGRTGPAGRPPAGKRPGPGSPGSGDTG